MVKNLLIVMALVLGLSLTVEAAIINGGFETGDLTGWSSYGYAYVVNSYTHYSPVEGSYLLALGTGMGTGVYSTVYQTIQLNAGDRLNGWAGFDAGDYFPDDAFVRVINADGVLYWTPWHRSVNDVGSYGNTPWEGNVK